MSEVSQLKQEIAELRAEVQQGFAELREWKQATEVGMRGNDDHGIWGYKQKIDYNRKKIDENHNLIESTDRKVNKIIWMAVGGGSVAGTAAAIIFGILQTFIGG